MKKTLQILLAGAGLALMTSPALADAGLTANVAVTSDYIFRGITQSAKKAALQGGLDYDFGNGLAVGTWMSTIDFGDDSPMELDLYGNYNFMIGALAASVGVYGYVYPSSGSGGPYDVFELDGGISYSFGPVAWSAKANWAPSVPSGYLTVQQGNNPDSEFYLTTGLSVPVVDWLSVSGNLSYQGYTGLPTGAKDDSYAEWDLGATATWKIVSLDLRYIDTDTHTLASYTGNPFATGPFYVATLTVRYTFP